MDDHDPDSDDDDDLPEFARQTRVVDFGQITPAAATDLGLAKADPLPANLLVVFRPLKGPGTTAAVEMHKPIVILGRVAGIADVAIEDEAASRYHASVAYRQGKFTLKDMGSTNGTFVNRRRVSEVELRSGDQIRIGVTVLSFEISERC